jgi:hypothetical protein
MVWFLVDDNLTFHKKVTAAGNAAMGVWVRAGAWSAANLTDGYVPSGIVSKFGRSSDVNRLITSGLWSRVTDGYQFHDWNDIQPTSEQIKQRREQARQRTEQQRSRPAVTRDKADVTRDVTRDLTRARPMAAPYGAAAPAPVGARAREPAPSAATSAESARGAPPQTNKYDWTAIPNCDLCDDEGRKPNGIICDHIDRRFTNARGAKQVRETMGWKT